MYQRLIEQDSLSLNSFVVGSSRSGVWFWNEWEKHLDSTARAFNLHSDVDGLYNAYERLKFVYNHEDKVDYVLLIIDHEWLSKDYPSDEFGHRTPWPMRENQDFFAYQKAALNYYFSFQGFKHTYRLGDRHHSILDNLHPYIDERGGRHYYGREGAVLCDPEYYYYKVNQTTQKLYPRDSVEQVGEPVISEMGTELLSQIHELFVNGNTNYKIVVSPLYDQIKLNPADKSILDSIFGAENVYDYSGINKYTNDSLNYYESSHYRPRVARQIMNEIYGVTENESGQ